jgi:hypothetical protein
LRAKYVGWYYPVPARFHGVTSWTTEPGSGSERLTVGPLDDASRKTNRPKFTGSVVLLRPVLDNGGSAFIAALAYDLHLGQSISDPRRKTHL